MEVVRVGREEGRTGVTTKASLRLADGLEAELVHIPMGRGRHTLCISSQVGCKMGCAFCETARLGLLRPMTPAEILSQLDVARDSLGLPFERIVFMGMGEPLDRPDILEQVLRTLTDPGGLAMRHDRITVCTVGVVSGIRHLRSLGMKRLNLSVSLNAANDALRSRLMPVNRRTPLAELQKALVDYRQRPNFQLGVNYCLMPELNDSREDARDVARFCAPLGRVLVSLIPYNPGGEPLTRAPREEEVVRFVEWLREEGLPVRRRITKGRGTMAACGQLGNVALRRAR
jgi:23S rRNA (adenine2503-C2)-methyltransferase